MRGQCCLRALLDSLLWLIMKIFFSEVSAFNKHQIPKDGPVIFVCAPHANQFIDPVLVQHHVLRRIGFLAAKKSFDQSDVGPLIRAMGSIPVMRPQDYKKKVAGTITNEGNIVRGVGTAFMDDFAHGESLYVSSNKEIVAIAEVKSDTEMVLKEPFSVNVDKPSPISSVPKIDQNDVYDRVFDALQQGKCIGIFPEGGSHDRTTMLPLKAGVTVMALGAMAKHDGLNVKIVPVGLNYYRAHRFRSHAYVDFGTPITIPPEYVQMYKDGKESKRKACSALLDVIYRGLKQVTINAPDYEQLQLLRLLRRLYNPPGVRLSVAERLELTRRFADAYDKLQNHPRAVKLVSMMREYNASLKHFDLKDYQVPEIEFGFCYSFTSFFWRLVRLLVFGVLAAPGVVLFSPIGLVASRIANRKAVEAKQNSNVKIAGRDVLATWKVLVAMVVCPAMMLLYTAIVAVLLNVLGRDTVPFAARVAVPIVSFFAWPVWGYVTVRFTETALQILFSLRPLAWAMCSCCPGTSRAALIIRQQRAELQQEVFSIVEELGPDLYTGGDREKFEKQFRIIKSSDLASGSPRRSHVQSTSRDGDANGDDHKQAASGGDRDGHAADLKSRSSDALLDHSAEPEAVPTALNQSYEDQEEDEDVPQPVDEN